MKWIANLKIGTKIALLAVILLAFLVSVGAYSILNMGNLNSRAEDMFKNQVQPILLLNNVRFNTTLNYTRLTAHLYATETAQMDEIEKDIQQRAEEINNAIEGYKKTSLSVREKEGLPKFEAAVAAYRPLRAEVLRLSKAGQKDAARIQNMESLEAMNKVFDEVSNLVGIKEDLAKANFTASAKAYKAMVRNFIIILVVAVILAIFIVLVIARAMSRPIKALEKAAEKVAEGDLTTKVNIGGRDEIGSLARSITSMIENMRQAIHTVHNSATQVASSAQQLSASTEQSTQAVTQISQSAQELAAGSEKQSGKVQDTMAVIQESSAAIDEIAGIAQKVAGAAQETSELAKDGNKAMNLAMSEMEKINVSTREVSTIINELGTRSQAIGQIIEVITNITDQTNLLSLNAAIEAARAGEQGRGFAVVADEVRKLAEQSQQAAKEIASLIHEIQNDTARAVQAMQNNAQLVNGGTNVIAEGAESFQRIGHSVESVATRVQEVSSSTEELAKGSEEMVNAVKTIGEIAQQVATSAQEMAASTEEETASVEEIAASADELARLGQELEKAVAKFRL